ncbi:type II toxin-antitoxin system RelE/ParE family toxin [Agrobacterium rubi]|uniref:Type II toxin-antitoxin system RelE/ParE family toxin n=1 Tax=Agrobacterium rubi TaxID=28099 RepID=A0AAE7UNN8_9HYPH|nr:type II toxin-antitoxin system RelE/ParE family toxin [Agrobacterium rubi]NTE85916.1 type II toxin-antitoxin system RelE/ParE family toxin [Agrobacterium rubi]NTF01847.1 type II toxin-antitoxin system RelE/ParE family toxin [Agrobacterium rubi]NTF36091.1 type II toxin-antitoxin system RelE/ParE family toxin [Agrobacterium rubi]OCJ54726.1 plasmid stabilization protein [Agrobacterium rubi]QTG01178.1 type II toxin-antitoxin system RelE/ParE family toxin [Agrobacterium rubi]
MTVKLVWTPLARADVKKIYVELAKVNPQSAERYFQRFRARAELLVDHPRAGERRPEIFPTARMLVEAPYVILYETMPDAEAEDVVKVQMVRVIDGRRDLTAFFEQ